MKIKFDLDERTKAEIQNSREPVDFMEILEALDKFEKELMF